MSGPPADPRLASIVLVHDALDALRRLFRDAETRDYIGEPVSQAAHALQAASLASDSGAPDAEVLAALLHDLGHLCAPDDAPRMGAHGVERHEEIGADRLAALGFGPDVTELVRGHVAAKRYRVATRPDYAALLSRASTQTLRHQGGPMSPAEVRAFEASPLRDGWLRLRSWDEAAKRAGLVVPGFDAYVDRIRAHLAAHSTR